MSLSVCCVKGFQWDGEPAGRVDKIAGQYDTYVAGDSTKAAVLIVHDIYGWETTNVRLMADHYAREAGVTVYVPDFFLGERIQRSDHPDLTPEAFLGDVVMPFAYKHGRDAHEKDVFAVARALRRDLGYQKVAAIGFCYGGWATLRLGAAAANQPADPLAAEAAAPIAGPLVDAVAFAHPSFVIEKDLAEVAVPLLALAPEHDGLYTAELKRYTFEMATKNGLLLDYLHFPGVEHGSLMRGDESVPGERAAMVRGKAAAVNFFKQHLDV